MTGNYTVGLFALMSYTLWDFSADNRRRFLPFVARECWGMYKLNLLQPLLRTAAFWCRFVVQHLKIKGIERINDVLCVKVLY
jgi:hypothetical protein